MKISVYTFPFRGHTLQATKIANYLSSKGHKVMFDTHPDFFKYLSKEIIKKETLYTYLTPQDNIDKDTLLNCAEGILLTSKNYLQDFENSCEKPDLIIFDSMVWDVFMFFTLGYIFVFTVSNLAMSFSGNKFSQIVATCLILFLIPLVIM